MGLLTIGAFARAARLTSKTLRPYDELGAASASLGRSRVRTSMGRTGSALDNAVAEAFNSTLEWELLSWRHFATREQARKAVAVWIDEYNTTRRHSTNGMLSPAARACRARATAIWSLVRNFGSLRPFGKWCAGVQGIACSG